MIMMALLHMAGLENSECIWKIQRNDWKIENVTFAEYSCPIPWSKEEEGAYIFWMKQVPVLIWFLLRFF